MTSEGRREARYQRRKAKRDEARLKRSMACGDFEEVFSFRHLYLSGKKCCKGVYWKNSTQRYIGNIIPNTATNNTISLAALCFIFIFNHILLSLASYIFFKSFDFCKLFFTPFLIVMVCSYCNWFLIFV